jgi:hypothetical protein
MPKKQKSPCKVGYDIEKYFIQTSTHCNIPLTEARYGQPVFDAYCKECGYKVQVKSSIRVERGCVTVRPKSFTKKGISYIVFNTYIRKSRLCSYREVNYDKSFKLSPKNKVGNGYIKKGNSKTKPMLEIVRKSGIKPLPVNIGELNKVLKLKQMGRYLNERFISNDTIIY